MGKLFKIFSDNPGGNKKCGGFVHGYVQTRGDNEQFCIQITPDAGSVDNLWMGYVMKLSDREAKKLYSKLAAFLYEDGVERASTEE